MGLSDLELVDCIQDKNACEPLNESLAADACMRYQCHPKGKGCILSVKDSDHDGAVDPVCKEFAQGSPDLDCDDADSDRYPSNLEVCDGIDNDCDYLIDEGVFSDPENPPLHLFDSSFEPLTVIYGPSGPGELALTYATSMDEERDGRFALLSGASYSVEKLLLAPNDCRTAQDDENETNGGPSCNLAEIVTAKTASGRIAAAINVDGCREGQLRVGFVSEDTNPAFETPMPEGSDPLDRSNSYKGIDVDADAARPCSELSHPDTPGVARLNMAALEPAQQAPQALLLWLGDTIERDQCGDDGEPIPVQALGLWLETEPGGKKWIQASNNAVPQTLGKTRGGGRSAIALWPGPSADRGYFVGYGDDNGQVALHYILPLDELPDYRESADWQTPEISITAPYNFVGNRTDADHVAIAPANASEKSIRPVCGPGQMGFELGVAWLEECGSDNAGLFFTIVGFVTATKDFCFQNEIIELARGESENGRLIPSIVYVGDGFLEPGFERDGNTVTADSTGGWLVAWAGQHENQSAVLARRIAEFDGKLVDEDEIIVLSSGLEGTFQYPVLYPAKDEGVHYSFYQNGSSEGFVGGDLLSCRAD